HIKLQPGNLAVPRDDAIARARRDFADRRILDAGAATQKRLPDRLGEDFLLGLLLWLARLSARQAARDQHDHEREASRREANMVTSAHQSHSPAPDSAALATNKQKSDATTVDRPLKPMSVRGLEPLTNGLRGHCSAIELHARYGSVL